MIKPIDSAKSILPSLEYILTDLDDTLTLDGTLPAVAYDAVERLNRAGKQVIVVTGRPAGWCDLIARFWPVTGVVGENGAFYFRYLKGDKRMLRVFEQGEPLRQANRRKLLAMFAEAATHFEGLTLASDQGYRESDLAIDFCEDVPPRDLGEVRAIAHFFQERGAEAKISSIHVNVWIGAYDKLKMALRLLRDLSGRPGEKATERTLYVGDSPNDEPMFAHFPISAGVANVAPFLDMMKSPPAYMTTAKGGLGFCEIADLILRA